MCGRCGGKTGGSTWVIVVVFVAAVSPCTVTVSSIALALLYGTKLALSTSSALHFLWAVIISFHNKFPFYYFSFLDSQHTNTRAQAKCSMLLGIRVRATHPLWAFASLRMTNVFQHVQIYRAHAITLSYHTT